MGTAFLPGFFALALAALLVFALRRWFDPVRPFDLWVYALVLTALFGRALFAGDSLLPLDNLRGEVPFERLAPAEPHGNPLQSDLLQLIAPAQNAVRSNLVHGRWPSWSAEMGAGMPLLADLQAQALQPLTLAAVGLAPARAAGLTAALKVLLALVFTSLWLRRQGLSGGVALAGSLAWGLGGFVILWLGWPLSSSAAWLPVVLYAVARCQDHGGARDTALLSLALAGLLLGGHPETIGYALALSLLVAWSRGRRPPPELEAEAGRQPRAPSARQARWRLVGATGVAVLLAAPVLLPAALYAPRTLRASRLAEAPTSTPVPASERAVGRLLPVVAPNAFGNDRFVHYWGQDNVNEDAAGFVGTACLLLVMVGGLGQLGRRAGRRPPGGDHAAGGGPRPQEALMWVVMLATAGFLALPPGLPELLNRLPGAAVSSYHHRLLLVLGFSLVYLAACELERWRHRGRRAGPMIALGLAVTALTALLAWGYLAHPPPGDPSLMELFRQGWLRWQLRFLGAAAALLAISLWTGGRKRWLSYGFAALLTAELLLIHGPANPPMPDRLAFPASPPLAFLQARAAAASPGEPRRLVALGRALPANLASVYGLADLRTAGPMAPSAVHAATAPLIEGWQGEAPVYGNPEHPLYDRLGVRWVLSAPGIALPAPLRSVLRDPSGWVWERPGALPPVRWGVLGPDQVAPGARGEGGETGKIGEAGERAERRAELRIERGEGVAWRAHYSSPPPARLETALFQDGGWRVLVDGRRVAARGVALSAEPGMENSLLRGPLAAGPFLGAILPAGTHRLDLVYRSPGLLWGCLLAALGWAALLSRALRPR